MSIIAAALLVLLVAAELSIGSDDRHDRSYHAGYVAASHGSWVRDAMATRGMTSSTLCESVADRTLTGDEAVGIVRGDFIDGCTRAVAEAME
ncbi:hypothetical protein MJO55_28230 (plasmid) [Mycolicibacterium rufum]|uniref:Uncharacterized protein n=1 Tax=Mycolicibacterium rufum TaxID=318424 RepID=A0A9X2YEI8_9MYCO|nr:MULTISPECIES: hypothetical protein [Mycobacteriaceae]KGI66011.1 hypothetical protein EU78_28025 [Mycolicibacterium rufum]MCV7071818.1 hypothetical protein [Mycolicibacterium rufum]MCX2715254.1 hypothetical protein [Mycolicibacterium sp. J2]MDO3208812.1 hypothetical protein [Mycobacteroides abscessus subsp. massiliense]ULP40035.1 hypothetical protein MJO55_28230 [Mycolicibacterium rufum]